MAALVGLTAAALSVLLAVPAHAAAASNIKPANLPACTTAGTATGGGWDTRTQIGTGTDDETWAFQVRPRTVTLGEVCLDGGNLKVPYKVQDLPTEGSHFPGATVWGACAPDGHCAYVRDLAYSRDGTNRWTFCIETTAPYNSHGAAAHGFGIRTASGGSSYYNPTDTQYTTYAPDTAICNAIPVNYRSYLIWGTSEPTIIATRIFDYTTNTYSPGASENLPNIWGSTIGARMELGYDSAGGTAELRCSTSASGSTTSTTDLTAAVIFQQDYVPTFVGDDYDNPIWEATGTYNGLTATGCAYLVSLSVLICEYDQDNERVCELHTWTADAYEADLPYPTDPPDVAMCKEQPSNPNCDDIDLDIVCEIEYTDPGNPITVIAEFFGGLGPWALCMTVPVGWDREGIIARTWETGEAGSLQRAFDAAMPNGIACGEVFNVTTTSELGNISFSTCQMDVLPTWAKYVVSGAIVLGIAALAIKRIMWSVGSKG